MTRTECGDRPLFHGNQKMLLCTYYWRIQTLRNSALGKIS
jgi:hypothetical protein